MKGILFKEDMFKLVVEGKKTQTRRIIKDVPGYWDLIGKGITQLTAFIKPGTGEMLNVYPRYRPWEIVYLKEPFFIPVPFVGFNTILYKYLSAPTWVEKWKNKLFMPEKYARYFILIKQVKVEKLCDISGPDAIAEGFGEKTRIKGLFKYGIYGKARIKFWKKWDEIHGTGSFIKLSPLEIPWVWVYEFELIKKGCEVLNPNERILNLEL